MMQVGELSGEPSGDAPTASTSGQCGFASFAEYIKRNQNLQFSDCREIVKMENATEAEFERIVGTYPDYCFKYIEGSLLSQHEFNIAKMAEVPASKKNNVASRPVFYARIGHCFSPYDFSLQPKAWDQSRQQLLTEVNDYYSEKSEEESPTLKMLEGMACVAKVDGFWYRAKVCKWIGSTDVLIRSADIGFEHLVPCELIRPLLKKFGRLPPLALESRMADVIIDTLSAPKINDFRNEIEKCNYTVRVELVDCCSLPVLVNLYHPTLEGCNIGKGFYYQERAKHNLESKLLKREKKAKEASDDEEDTDVHSTSESSVAENYVLYLSRLEKPFVESQMFISHIENARFIYFHTEYHLKAIETMELQLSRAWDELPQMQTKYLVENAVCGFAANKNKQRHAYRGIISAITDSDVEIRAVDHGWRCILPFTSLQDMRVLDRRFADTPFVHLCRLKNSMLSHPHFSETNILRELLPVGTLVTVKCEKKSHRVPPQVVIICLEDGKDIMEEVESKKKERRILHPCLDLIQYDAERIKHLSFKMPESYCEELQVFAPFAKGRLKFFALSEEVAAS